MRHRQATGQRRIKDLQPQEDRVFINHILSRMTPPNPDDPATPTSMLSQVIHMDKSKSAQALAAVYFGKMCNHKAAYEKGSRLYVEALDQLRHTIVDQQMALKPETLASVLCLCIYENVALSEPLAWVRHYGGVSRLVEMRGPNCQRNEPEMDGFRVCRFMIILWHGIERRRCFLANPEWKSSRWRSKGFRQYAVDLLHDIFAEVPGIYHKTDQLTPEDKANKSEAYCAARDHIRDVARALRAWPENLQQARLANRFGAFMKLSYGPSVSPPPPSQTDAAALALCYAVLLCLNGPSTELGVSLMSDTTPFVLAQEKEATRQWSVEISHLSSSALRSESATAVAFFLIFPMQVAHQHMTPGSPEAQRLEGLMGSIVCDTHGFEIGKRRSWDHPEPGGYFTPSNAEGFT